MTQHVKTARPHKMGISSNSVSLAAQKKLILATFWTLFWLLFVLTTSKAQAQTPLRVVSLKPNITEALVELGAGSNIVGITRFCKNPNNSAAIVADYTSIAIEDVLRLRPDVVFTSDENAQERQVRELKSLGLNVVMTSFKSYEDMIKSLEIMAKNLNLERNWQNLQAKLTTSWQEINALVTKLHLENKRMLVLVQHHPVMIASGSTFISSLLTRAKFTNIYEANRISYPQLSDEDFLRANVDIVFDLSYDAENTKSLLGRPLTRLPIDEFLAEPGSVFALKEVLSQL